MKNIKTFLAEEFFLKVFMDKIEKPDFASKIFLLPGKIYTLNSQLFLHTDYLSTEVANRNKYPFVYETHW